MATSFTSLLGLALPVTGELAGTWGDTVNNSITSLLDSAVAGTTTLSTDADVTLTTTTGSSNQSRQAILLCSGARTVLRNITAPAQSKIYVVVNSTTGGFGVVIRGVGPTTGVTVAAGKTAVVVWNGSDFVEVAPATATTATNLAGGVAGSVPYQTGAGVTTFLGIGTANYVLTSTGTAPTWTLNTGTGSVVRATSPTLDTPTFTTSATFPLHIGGTATTSTLMLRSTSGVGTTGADIIFQTGNNGATEAMRVLNSGNLGVGTTGPSEKLHVNGSGLFSGDNNYISADNGAGTVRLGFFKKSGAIPVIAAGSTSAISFGHTDGASIQTPSTAVFTENMRIDTAGNVGVGTASPGTKLEVSGAAKANYAIASGPLAAYASSSGGLYSYFTASAGTLNAVTDNSGTAGTLILATGSERMRITSVGDVGVGTANPGVKLDVVGSVKAQNSSTKYVLMDASTTRPALSLYADTDTNAASILNFFNTSTSATITSGRTQDIRFFYSDTAGTNTLSAGIRSYMAATGAANATGVGLTFETKNTTDSASVERMRVLPSGALLVGATAQVVAETLSVYGNTNGSSSGAYPCLITAIDGRAYNSTAPSPGGGITFGYKYNVGGSSTLGPSIQGFKENTTDGDFAGALKFLTRINGASPAEVMRITSAGNVGIGTAAPAQLLHIASGDATALIENTAATSNATLQLKYPSRTWALANRGSDLSGAFAIRDTTAGADRLIITSAGNVGIGTTTIGSPLTVYAGNNQATIKVTNGPSANNVGITLESLGGNVVLNNGNGPFELSTGGSIRAVVTTAGNVGIGTATPNSAGVSLACTLNASSITGGGIYELNAAGTRYAYLFANSSNTVLSSVQSAPILFKTQDAERMRIDSAGNVLINRTSAYNDGSIGTPILQVNAYTGARVGFATIADSTAATAHIGFVNPNGTVGSISTSGTSTSYVTSSDYRLKENVLPITGALAKVAALKPVSYTWKVDGEYGEGFIAHELQEVCPLAVTGNKDDIGSNGKPIYQGIDPSKIIGLLTAAIKELKAEIDALKGAK